MSSRLLLLIFVTALLVPPARAQGDDAPTERQLIAAHIKAVRSNKLTWDDKVDDMEALIALGAEGSRVLAEQLARDLKRIREDRLADQGKLVDSFTAQARRIGLAKAGRENAAEVERLRKVVRDGEVTKDTITQQKDPAVAQLRELLLVRPGHVWDDNEHLYEDFGALLDAHDDEDFLYGYWFDAREVVRGAEAGERLAARLKDLPDPLDEDQALLDELDEICRYALAMTEQDREVMHANAADFADIDPKEADGIVDLNDLRVLVGLNALRVDVKLCKACRGHSRDMVEVGFFAHDSPVEGKETPWKRAALEGTSAGAENIAAGAAEGPDAIRMWWYSPGHHRNMLGGHRRVGLGRHESHWTQCFGG